MSELITTSEAVSLISFGAIFAGSLAGIVLGSVLPKRYFTNEAKDVLRLGLGLVTMLSALVLGLLVSTAKSSYDAKRGLLTQIATDVVLMDRSLELYGPETGNARRILREQVAAVADQIDSLGDRSSKLRGLSSEAELSDFYQMVRRLSPRDDSQRALKAEVLKISFEVGQIRASSLSQESSSIPIPFLVVLVFWLTALFAGFGLFASRNPVAAVALCLCAFTVSTAIFLILDMDQPLKGLMRLSDEPLRNALAVIGNQR
jgi:hypothetical protein